jgi:hypothetical protein
MGVQAVANLLHNFWADELAVLNIPHYSTDSRSFGRSIEYEARGSVVG